MKHSKKSNVYASQLKMGLLVAFCILPLLFIAEQCKAQKSKRIEVAKTAGIIVSCHVQFDENNQPIDTLYHMIGRDSRYTSIVEFITLYSGPSADLLQLLQKCTDAYNEDEGTSLQFGSSHIYVTKLMGSLIVYLYGQGADERGYTYIGRSQITKLVKGINEHLTNVK